MEKRLVYHHNLIGHEINDSLAYFADDVLDREIYCRKKHQVLEPEEGDCMDCPYFAGLEQGHGHECAWEDVTYADYVVKHEERYKEYERVDKLMKQGILVRPESDLVAKVKDKLYDENEWIYVQSEDKTNRYLLGTRGRKTLVCCGVNPSFASPNDLDPTMNNVAAFAKANGYDSYIMMNLYPMRATNPDDMHKDMDKCIVRTNIEHIESVLSSGKCDIWAAWGTIIKKRAYLKECLKDIVEIAEKYNCKWYTIGSRSKEGHPHHPLYLNRQCTMELFDARDYLVNMK